MEIRNTILEYHWKATFYDGHVIEQPENDRYSKHDDTKEHNPSAFRDILDYLEVSPVRLFSLHGKNGEIYAVNLETAEFFINGSRVSLEQPNEMLVNRKLIYYRTKQANLNTGEVSVVSYSFGYEGKIYGKVVKKVVTI